jgi:tryptophanyl-tRNA synthetase
MEQSAKKRRLVTGDTPTGRLHLGHYVGSLENRLKLQDEYECFFIIANKHAFTTRSDKPEEIHQSVLDVAMDWLAVGLDPKKANLFIQSEVSAIDELTFFFSMLLPFNRVMRNPTLKDEIRDKGLGDSYPFGFPLYAVGQSADILAFLPDVVPVGKDQLPHVEMTREVARKFNILYCGVPEDTPDNLHLSLGGLFPIVEPLVGRIERLVGTGGPVDGRMLKMSKSLGNAIFLSDDVETVRKKVMSMYTDPMRKKASDPGRVEGNPVWIYHDAFNPDLKWIEENKRLYRAGMVGDVAVKLKLVEILNAFLEPIRDRRKYFESHPDAVIAALKSGTMRAKEVAEGTAFQARARMHQVYF